MAEENAASGTRWLLEPPDPGEVQFRISIGSDVELSPAARDALETLLDELRGDEVAGFALGINCTDFMKTCDPFTCSLTNCQPMVSRPCLADIDCHVTDMFRRRGI